MTDKLRSRRWKLALNIITLLALGALAYALRDQLVDVFHQFGEVNSGVLLLMIPLQALNYFSQAKLYQGVLRAVGVRFRTKPMIRLALELNFVSTVFPSGGVSGFSYLGLRLRDEGVSAAKATLVQMMRYFLMFVSMQVLLFVGLVALAIGGKANDFAILLAGIIGTLIVVLTVMVTFVIGSEARIDGFFTFITQAINRIIHVFRRRSPETISIHKAKETFKELHENYVILRNNLRSLKVPMIAAFSSVLTEVLTIYVVYIAFGEWINFGAVTLAYAVANFAGLVSILPGGIGIYEALMTAVLAIGGVPAALSLSATVMYRVLNMVIQLIPGYYFYNRTLHVEPNIEHFEHD